MLKRNLVAILISLASLGWSGLANAVITISHAQVTDVTTSGFSVIWHADAASDPAIAVYTDVGASVDITDQVEVIAFPLQGADSGLLTPYEQAQSKRDLRQAARGKGLNKVLVRGLQPNTTYYIQVSSDSGGDSGVWPSGSTQAVTTQQENAFLQDGSVLVVDINEPDVRGWLVTAQATGTNHPVSGFAEAGAEPGQAVINLANLFAPDGTNWYSDLTTTLTIQIIKDTGELITETLDVNLSTAFAVASNYPFSYGSPFDAIIELIAPASKVYTQGESVTLGWTDTADSVNATISLYIDVDTSGEDGTLIASGIDEDPDGTGDEYLWDVAGVTEGSYYVYAVMSDGSNSVSHYNTSKITIDHTQTSGDGDTLSDLWEQHFFDTLARDGSGDFDSDTIIDDDEFYYLLNPEVANAPLAGLTLGLKEGKQIIGVPGALIPRLTAYELLTQLGVSVLSISRYNPVSGLQETAYWDAGSPAGDDFPLLPGQGYIVAMAADDTLIWSPFNTNRGVPLSAGVNMVAITNPAGDAFGLLDQLGSDVIWSIRRIDPLTSLSETAAFDGTEKIGVPFTLQYGEGYIVTVKQGTTLN